MNTPYRISPLHQWHLQNGGRFVSVAGWESIESYGEPVEEAFALANSVGLRDLTPLSKIEVQGKNSTEVLTRFFGAQVPEVGSCSIVGFAQNERTYFTRLTTERYLLLTSPSRRVQLYGTVTHAATPQSCFHVTDLTSAYAAFHIVGPKATELLKTMGPGRLDAMKPWSLTQSGTARVASILLRHEFRGSAAWLLLVSRDYAEYVWTAILRTGARLQIRPFGSTAARSTTAAEEFDVAAVL